MTDITISIKPFAKDLFKNTLLLQGTFVGQTGGGIASLTL